VSATAQRTTLPSGKRWYDWQGEKYWSVTTILGGGLPKKALVYWAANEVANFACDNTSEIASLVAKDQRDAAYDMLKRSPWRKTEKAADLGTAVHEAVEAHLKQRPMPTWPLPIRPRMEAFVRFMDDYQPHVEMAEQAVFNRTERYAGTLDLVLGLTLPGADAPGVYETDTKSGKDVYPDMGLQLAAYRHSEFCGLPDGSERPMPATDGGLILHLSTDGSYRLVEMRCDDQVFRSFLYIREVYRFVEETSKTMLLADHREGALI
jgi:hypothetical protein